MITGETFSSDFPVTTGAFQTTFGGVGLGSNNAFVVQFDGTGAREWATYYGGNHTDEGQGITTDANENILLTGSTNSTNFPVSSGAFQSTFGGTESNNDAFIIKFNGTGSRQWATFLGDSSGGTSIATDANGNVIITGSTMSTIFPVTTGAYQMTNKANGTNYNAFIAKFDGNGNQIMDNLLWRECNFSGDVGTSTCNG